MQHAEQLNPEFFHLHLEQPMERLILSSIQEVIYKLEVADFQSRCTPDNSNWNSLTSTWEKNKTMERHLKMKSNVHLFLFPSLESSITLHGIKH